MKRPNTLPATILAVLLLGCLVAVYLTRDSGNNPAPARKIPASDQTAAIDSSLLNTANQLTTLAETADEQNQALQALHLADHELDQAFATALRQAAAYRPPANGPLRALRDRISELQAQITADQASVAQLAKQTSSNAADQLELAQAQLALDKDELADAQQDLALQGGDPHAAIQRALQDHEATQHNQSAKTSGASPTGTLFEQTRAWFSLKSRDQQLLAAEQQATAHTAALTVQHDQLQKEISSPQTDTADGSTADSIASLRRLSDLRKSLTEVGLRIQDSQQLAAAYKSWSVLAETRKRTVLHLLLGSLAEILAILLAAFLANLAIRRLFQKKDSEQRGHQIRVMAAVIVQLLAVVLILLVLFGPPSQVSTIIGLATAGLTVVLKDFIVAFFGWFTLMGKDGIRVGDWVEINGVSGEVIDVGLLKTVLLESGNWSDAGHPTGRQVAFSNSFAMEGHYFNFSTTGQWLWDELQVTLPVSGDPYLMAEEIRKLVERETETDSAGAAQDWEHVTSKLGARSFSAKPTVNLRPGINGLEVTVRYITRAPQRYVVKSKLFQVIVDLLHKPVAVAEPRQ